MRWTFAGLGAGAALISAFAAPTAVACSPSPSPPGETEAAREVRLEAEWQAFQRDQQKDLWSRADRVFLARVVRPPPPATPPPIRRRDGAPRPPDYVAPQLELRKRLEPFATLRGPDPSGYAEIRYEPGGSACGAVQLRDAIYAEEGDLVVVFARAGYPSEDSLLEAIKPDRIIDPGIKAALAEVGR